MDEEVKVSRLADFDRVDPSESYVVGCLLIPRDDQKGVMFDVNIAPGKVCARLEGYAIIPKEQYEFLIQGKVIQTELSQQPCEISGNTITGSSGILIKGPQ